MLLKNKVAVITEPAGQSAVLSRAPSRARGARSFSPGASGHRSQRSRRTSFPPADSAEAAEVDAVDEQAVDTHLQSVIDKVGRVDISFNAIGIPDAKILGVPLVELDVEQFSLPIATYTRSGTF